MVLSEGGPPQKATRWRTVFVRHGRDTPQAAQAEEEVGRLRGGVGGWAGTADKGAGLLQEVMKPFWKQRAAMGARLRKCIRNYF